MPTTDRDAELKHMVGVWLGASDEDSPVGRTLRAGNLIQTSRLANLVRTPGAIDKMRYTDPSDGKEKELTDDQKLEIAAIYSYQNWLRNTEGCVNKDSLDISSYTRDDFLDYVDNVFDPTNPIKYDKAEATENMRKKELHELTIANLSNQTANTMTGSTVTTSTNTSSGGNTSQNRSQSNALNEEEKALNKAMLPSVDALSSIVNDHDFAYWFLIFVAELNKQGFKNVLDPKYTPTADQKSIFEKRKEILYSFLVKHLKTEKGKDIVGKHSETADAQAVWKEFIAYHTTSPTAESMRTDFLQKITTARITPGANLKEEILRLKSYFRAYNSFTATPLTKQDENNYMRRFASQSKDISNVASLTSLVESVSKTTIGPEEKMELIEIQAAMADNADDAQNNIPTRRHSVHQTLVQDRGEHLEVDLGDGFITVMKMSSSGVSTPSFRVPKVVWDQLSPEDKSAWLSMSKAGRTLVINSSQQLASPLASALRQRPPPQGQSQLRTQNQRVSFHGLSDAQFDASGNFMGGDGNDGNDEEQNNQDSDGNERIQCTMTQVSDNSQLPEAPDRKDTLLINAIKQPGNCSELHTFDPRRFMANAQPPKDSDTQAEANASYDPIPSSQNEVTPSSTGKSKSRLSRLFKKRTASAVNNAINNAIAIFALICLVRFPQVVTAMGGDAKRALSRVQKNRSDLYCT